MDQFASIVLLPYRFTDETNKVLVFTEVSKPELLIYICHEPCMLVSELVVLYVRYPALRRLFKCFTELTSLTRIHLQQCLNMLTSILNFLSRVIFTYLVYSSNALREKTSA